MQNIEVALKLVDKFSAELKKMGEAVHGLEGSIQKQVKEMNSHFDNLQSSVSKTAQRTQKHFQGMQNGMSAMSTSFVRNALAMGASIFAIDKAAEALMSFDDARARVVGLAGLNKDQTKQLTASALQIGGSTEFSATDVMSAYAVNARMIKDVETLKQVTAVQTNLATLGQTSITDIAQNSSTLVTILGLNGEEMIKFGDSVAYMTTMNNKSIVSNLEALTEAAPLLKQFGNDFNDAVALVGIAPSIQSSSGSELGTKFRAMITEGLNSTVRLARKGNVDNMNVIKNLRLTPDDLDLSKRKLIDVFQTISDALKKGGKLDSHGLFGSYGMLLGNALVKDIDKIKEAQAEVENVKGKLGEMSAPMRKTLRANLGNAAGAVEELIVKLGDAGLTGAIISAANAFTVFFNFLSRNPAIVTQLFEIGKILVMIFAMRGIISAGIKIASFFRILSTSAVAFAAVSRTAFAAHPLLLFLTALSAAIYAMHVLIKLWNDFNGVKTPEITPPSQSQGGAFWETKDGQMTPYTQQSKQKITTDVNVIFENPPEGTKAVATQRGTSGVDVGTTSIIQSLYRHALGSLL